MVFDPHRQPVGGSALRLRRVRIFSAVLCAADASGQAQPRASSDAVCVLILISRVADKWWLVLPEFSQAGPFWLDAAAMLALGGLMLLLFFWGCATRAPQWRSHRDQHHG